MITDDLRDAIATGHADALARAVGGDPERANATMSWEEREVPLLVYLIGAPFHGLCPRGEQTAMAGVLLDAGAAADWDPMTDERAETPLMTAVSVYELGIVDLLIRRGVDLERRGGAVDGGTALDLGIAFAATREVDRLVGAGAELGTQDRAAGGGALDELRRHLQDSAPTDRAVVGATINARFRCLAALREAGADLQANYGEASLLHWAAWYGRPEVVEHLLSHGLDPKAVDPNHGRTPRGWALHRRDDKGWPFPDGLTAAAEVLERAGG